MKSHEATMKTFSRRPRLALAGLAGAAILLLAPACTLPEAQPDLTRYYVLTAPTRSAVPSAVAPHWRVALRTVEVPSFLRGRAIPVRVAENELVYADEARWAETLEAGISRVLRESLEGRGEIARVVDSLGEDHDFNIVVTVLRCEGDRSKGVARFSAAVAIYSTAPGAARRAREVFTLEVPNWDKQNYGQLAGKLSEGVDALGERIVALLATTEKP